MRSVLFLFLLLLRLNAHATEYSLIVNSTSSIKTLDTSEIRDLFLHKRSYSGEQKVIPINLLADNDARKIFESSVLKMDRRKLNAYWVKQHFKGISPPVTQASFEAVIRFVKNVKGAIGYVPSSSIDSELKVLYEF